MKLSIIFIAILYSHSSNAGLFDFFNTRDLSILSNLVIPKDFDINNVKGFKCFDVTQSFDGKPWNPLTDSFDNIFNRFKIKYNKDYSIEELPQRRANLYRAIYTIAKCIIESFSDNNGHTLDLTSIADLSTEEYQKKLGTKPSEPSKVQLNDKQLQSTSSDNVCQQKTTSALPQSLDWRNKNYKNYVTSVKNQLNCGSCWAFATTATIESQYIIKSGQSASQIDQSEQDLLNCVTTSSCSGGTIESAMDYVKANGQAREDATPYIAQKRICKHYPLVNGMIISDYCRKGGTTLWTKTYPNGTVEKYTTTEDNPDSKIMRDLNEIGPLVIMINADDFQYYKSGIYSSSNCSKNVNHGVTLVGYGTESGIDYWIVKNSWDQSWGESGYFRLKRGENICGMNDMYFYPIMTSNASYNKSSKRSK